MRLAGSRFAAVLIQKLVDVRMSEAIANFDLANGENLAGGLRRRFRIRLVLKPHLSNQSFSFFFLNLLIQLLKENNETDFVHLEFHFDVLLPVGSAWILASTGAQMGLMRRRIFISSSTSTSTSSTKLDFLFGITFGESDRAMTFTLVTSTTKKNKQKNK